MARWGPFLLAAFGLLSQRTTEAFYLPGGSPKDFKQGDEVCIEVLSNLFLDFPGWPLCSA